MTISKLKIALSAIACGTLIAGAANAQEIAVPAKYIEADVIKVSVDPTFPPMGFRDPETNESTGIAIEVLKAVEAKLPVKLELVDTQFAQLAPSIESGRVDFQGSGVVDTPLRQEKLSFVDYLKTGPQIFTRMDASLESTADLCGKKVGMSRFSTAYPAAVSALSEEICVKAGKPPIENVTDDLPVQLGLLQNRYDAAILTVESAIYHSRNNPGQYKMVGAPIDEWLFGLGFLKTDTELRDAIAKAVDAIIADGSYAAVLEKWGIADFAVTATMIDAGK